MVECFVHKIGSIFWRTKHYGVIPALKYVIYNKLKIMNKKLSFNHREYLESYNFFEKYFNLQMPDFIKIETIINEKISYFGDKVEKKIFELSLKNSTNKGKNANELIYENNTRLKVLGYMIAILKIDCIIETGSQSGLSSLFMESVSFAIGKNDSLKIVSFDVKPSDKLIESTNVEFIVLQKPFRQSFKLLTRFFSRNHNCVLFFHDSDHSYENMTFEFEWAWDHLNVDFLVSDDVSENTAFSDFAVRHGISPVYCRFDNGSMVGIINRLQP